MSFRMVKIDLFSFWCGFSIVHVYLPQVLATDQTINRQEAVYVTNSGKTLVLKNIRITLCTCGKNPPETQSSPYLSYVFISKWYIQY